MTDENTGYAGAQFNKLELATELTIAWLNNPNNRVVADEVPTFLKAIHTMLNDLSGDSSGRSDESSEPQFQPAVPPRSSVKPDFLISLIDGKQYKTLKRHLGRHGLTPTQYRERYGLKPDYPMVAPNYSEMRRQTARKIGLGSKGRKAKSGSATAKKPAVSKRRRRPLKTPEK